MIMESIMITVKLSFEIQLLEDNRLKPADFNKLVVFFNNLKTIHTGVIKQCCEEYSKTYPKQQLREEHKLKFETIEKDNFLNFSLSFLLNHDEVEYYLTLIKLFFDFCKRYGKDANNHAISVQSVVEAFDSVKKIFKKNPTSNSKKSENSLLKAHNNLMKKDNFKRAYNSFCKTGILITKLTTNTDGLNDEIDFLDNKN